MMKKVHIKKNDQVVVISGPKDGDKPKPMASNINIVLFKCTRYLLNINTKNNENIVTIK